MARERGRTITHQVQHRIPTFLIFKLHLTKLLDKICHDRQPRNQNLFSGGN